MTTSTNPLLHGMPVQRPDHGISVVTVHLPVGNPLRAECLCGWQSPIVGSRPQAIANGQAHIEEFSSRTPRSGGICTSGLEDVQHDFEASISQSDDPLAAAVGARMRERGVRLDADELATVAMALDCTEAEIRGYCLESDADAVRLARPVWMSDDAQWMRLRAKASAYFESEGLVRDEVAK